MRELDKQLFKAASKGDVGAVAELLAQGADAKMEYRSLRATPLMVATQHGHARCVEALLPFSAPLAVDAERCSALIYASQHHRLDCAKLLAASSHIEHRDDEGMNAIEHARAWGDDELADFLVSVKQARMEAGEIEHAALPGSSSSPSSRL